VKESIVCSLWRFSLSLSLMDLGGIGYGIWNYTMEFLVCLIDFARRVSMLGYLL
jgi:hypothetical protein